MNLAAEFGAMEGNAEYFDGLPVVPDTPILRHLNPLRNLTPSRPQTEDVGKDPLPSWERVNKKMNFEVSMPTPSKPMAIVSAVSTPSSSQSDKNSFNNCSYMDMLKEKREVISSSFAKKIGWQNSTISMMPLDDFQSNGVSGVRGPSSTMYGFEPASVVSPIPSIVSPFSPLGDIQMYNEPDVDFMSTTKSGMKSTCVVLNDIEKEAQIMSKEREKDLLKIKASKAEYRRQREEREEKLQQEIQQLHNDLTVKSSLLAAKTNTNSDTEKDLEDAEKKLALLDAAHKTLQKSLIEAKSQASKLNEVSSINEQISGVARQLKKEIDDKDNEISTLRSTLTEQRTEIESLTIQTTTMDVLNQALNEELRNSQEMIDSIQSIRDIRETEDRNSREGISFSMLSHEEQESLRSELALNNKNTNTNTEVEEEMARTRSALGEKQEIICGLEAELSSLNEVMNTHSLKIAITGDELSAKDGALRATEFAKAQLEKEVLDIVNKLGELEAKLEAKGEGLRHAQSEVDRLKIDMKYKDEELMTLLQSSVQSTELNNKKLLALEYHLKEKEVAMENVQTSLAALEAEKEANKNEVDFVRDALTREIRSLHAKIRLLSDEKRQESEEFKNDANKKKGKITELEGALTDALNKNNDNNTKNAKLEIAYARIASLETTIKDLAQDVQNRSNDDIPPQTPPNTLGHARTPLNALVVDGRFVAINDSRKMEGMSSPQEVELRAKYETSQRQVENITEELQRSRSVLEKQLRNSTASESELANKVCDLNMQLEQLMNYSMKLTGDLGKSKETEIALANDLMIQRKETERAQRKLIDQQNPNREEELLKAINDREGLINEWNHKYSDLEGEMEIANETIDKAKVSKAKRYNKYVSLQQDYKLVVAQVERLVSENHDLRTRHKAFVKTVEKALVGGEGNLAMGHFNKDDFKTSPSPTKGDMEDSGDVENENRVNRVNINRDRNNNVGNQDNNNQDNNINRNILEEVDGF